jgi:hypothetical protein
VLSFLSQLDILGVCTERKLVARIPAVVTVTTVFFPPFVCGRLLLVPLAYSPINMKYPTTSFSLKHFLPISTQIFTSLQYLDTKCYSGPPDRSLSQYVNASGVLSILVLTTFTSWKIIVRIYFLTIFNKRLILIHLQIYFGFFSLLLPQLLL